MNIKIMAVTVLIALFALSGCEADNRAVMELAKKIHKDRDDYVRGTARHFITHDGLECVRFHWSNQGGVSCNWEKYNEESKDD